jgi:hypothetical protein
LIKRQAVLKLQSATDEELKIVVELLLNAESTLESKELKQCKGQLICSGLMKLKNISRKVLLRLFAKYFKQIVKLLGQTPAFIQCFANIS